MMLDTLDGYLTAIVLGPTTLDFGQWFPGIWGPSQDDLPNFKTMEEAQHIIDLVVRLMNGIIWDLEHNPDVFAPSRVDLVKYQVKFINVLSLGHCVAPNPIQSSRYGIVFSASPALDPCSM